MTRKASLSFLISGKVSSPRFLARAGDKINGKASGSQKNACLKCARMRYLRSGASTFLAGPTEALSAGDSDSMRPGIPTWVFGGAENDSSGLWSNIKNTARKATRVIDR